MNHNFAIWRISALPFGVFLLCHLAYFCYNTLCRHRRKSLPGDGNEPTPGGDGNINADAKGSTFVGEDE